MSTFEAPVVQLIMQKHPNADTLSTVQVFGYTCVVRSQDWDGVAKAVYLPVDTVPNLGHESMAWLKGTPSEKRVKAVRLRGIFSEGVLIKANPEWEIGQDVQSIIGVKKYEKPPQLHRNRWGMLVGERGEGKMDTGPKWFHVYSGIEHLKRYPNIITPPTQVIVLEKIHGQNIRVAFNEETQSVMVGTHKTVRKEEPKNYWCDEMRKHGMYEIAEKYKHFIFYGELYGAMKGMQYGKTPDDRGYVLFDIYDRTKSKFMDWDNLFEFTQTNSIPTPTVIYRGPFYPEITNLAEGNTLMQMDGKRHIREGFTIRPYIEMVDDRGNRIILKCVSQAYRLGNYDEGDH